MNKKWLILVLVIALGLVTFLVTAYSNGKSVASEPSLSFVSHTEYWSGDHASTIVRLVDYKGDSFQNVQGCIANIYYPDKSIFVSAGVMNQSSIPGNWYRTDEAPLNEGTYEQEVICTYKASNGDTKTTKASQSFHVNPALNFLKNISAETISTNLSVYAINMTITGTIENRTTNLSNQLTAVNTSLNELMKQINATLSQNISSSSADINTKISNVNITIQGKIAATGADILSNMSVSEGNLTSILKQINNTLNNQMAANNVTLSADLSDMRLNITGTITNAKTEILSAINASNTNLGAALALAKSDLSTQLINTNNSLDAKMTNVQVNLSTQMTSSQDAVQAQITSMNGSINDVITAAKNEELNYMKSTLAEMNVTINNINQTTSNIKTNTEWLVTNAMNKDDKTQIDSRFASVDGNLSKLEAMCGNELTQDSQICKDVVSLKGNISALRAENTNYFNKVDNTTISTYNLLSGSISTNIDSIMTNLGIIRAQTTDINQTVHDIRADQQNQVDIRIIS